MKHSEINFKIQLDDQNIPENITWSATDNPNEGIEETKAILVATWDPYHKGTLTLPLWTKDMEVLDMKRFLLRSWERYLKPLFKPLEMNIFQKKLSKCVGLCLRTYRKKF